MRSHDFPHPPANVQITPSCQALSTFSETDCLCTLWNKSLVQSLHVCYAYKKCWHSINNKLSPQFLCFLRLFYTFVSGVLLLSSSSQIVILHLQWIPVCMFYQSQLITNIETVLCSGMYMCMCAHIHAWTHTHSSLGVRQWTVIYRFQRIMCNPICWLYLQD
jgi:hypothetical protein